MHDKAIAKEAFTKPLRQNLLRMSSSVGYPNIVVSAYRKCQSNKLKIRDLIANTKEQRIEC